MASRNSSVKTNAQWVAYASAYINDSSNPLSIRTKLSTLQTAYTNNMANAQSSLDNQNGVLSGTLPTDSISGRSYNFDAITKAIKDSSVVIENVEFSNSLAYGDQENLQAYLNYKFSTDIGAYANSHGDWVLNLHDAVEFYTKEPLLSEMNSYVSRLTGDDQTAALNFIADLPELTKAVVDKMAKVTASIKTITASLDIEKGSITTSYVNQVKALIGGGKPQSPTVTNSGGANGGAGSGATAKPPVSGAGQPITPSAKYPPTADFNLPPHQWSLPLSAKTMESELSSAASQSGDVNRRGRFWFYADGQQQFTSTGNPSKDFGFQFIWNPTDYSTSVTLNTDITPSSSQYWSTALPVFPSGENLSVSVILDRTNDFACFGPYASTIGAATVVAHATAANPANQDLLNALTNLEQSLVDTASDVKAAQFAPYYANAGGNVGDKIADLMRRGTLADLEYLYKCINGDGWVRLDQATSDIGFLSLTLLEIELGPMRYLGYLNNLNISHQKFTEEMVPLTTQVDFQFVLMASSSVATNALSRTGNGQAVATS